MLNSIKTHINIFGSVFDNILIKRSANTTIKMPIAYANKDALQQMVLRRGTDPDNIKDNVEMTLPRLAFELYSIRYNGEQKLNRVHEYLGHDSNFSIDSVLTHVPYKLYMNLYVITNKNDDYMQVLEQILPVFTPDIKLAVNYETANTTLVFDESLVLLNNSKEIVSEFNFETQQKIINTLNFEMDCKFFFNSTQKQLIKEVNCNFYNYGEDIALENIELTLDSSNNIIYTYSNEF